MKEIYLKVKLHINGTKSNIEILSFNRKYVKSKKINLNLHRKIKNSQLTIQKKIQILENNCHDKVKEIYLKVKFHINGTRNNAKKSFI